MPTFTNTINSSDTFEFFKALFALLYALGVLAFTIFKALMQITYQLLIMLPLVILHLTYKLLETALFKWVYKNYFRMSLLIAAAVVFTKVALFGYYKYKGDEVNATNEKEQMLSWGEKALNFCKRHVLSLAKNIVIGMIAATLSLTTFVALNLAYRAAVSYFWPDYSFDEDYDDDPPTPELNFYDVVIFAPIAEELLFRGLILPLMKIPMQKIVNYFYPTEENGAITNDLLVIPQEPEQGIEQAPQQIATVQDRNKADKNWWVNKAANVCTAFLFSAAHIKRRQTYAFVGGIVSGELKENYGMTAAIAEHMTNNYIAYTVHNHYSTENISNDIVDTVASRASRYILN